MLKQEYCCLCFKRCKENSRRHVPQGIRFRHHVEKIMGRDVSNVDVICNCCSARVYKKIKVNDSDRKKTSHIEEPIVKSGNETKQTLKSPKSISLDIASTHRSHKYCVVCKHDGNRRIICQASLKQLQLKPLSKLGCLCFHIADVVGFMSNQDISTTKHLQLASFHPLTDITAIFQREMSADFSTIFDI